MYGQQNIKFSLLRILPYVDHAVFSEMDTTASSVVDHPP